MKLSEHNLAQFAEVLASDAPAPGGGSTAALEGALGAALAEMVGALTVGKKKYEEHEAEVVKQAEQSKAQRQNFIELIDKDTEAFNEVSAVFAMPKETDEDKAARKVAMQNALKSSTKTPFAMMEASLKALEATDAMLGKSNVNALSDLGVSALSLKAAIQGAWLNVLINIGGINDTAFVDEYRQKGEQLLAKALPLADKIYNAVLSDLQ